MSNYNYYNNYFNCFDIIQVWESEGWGLVGHQYGGSGCPRVCGSCMGDQSHETYQVCQRHPLPSVVSDLCGWVAVAQGWFVLQEGSA